MFFQNLSKVLNEEVLNSFSLSETSFLDDIKELSICNIVLLDKLFQHNMSPKQLVKQCEKWRKDYFEKENPGKLYNEEYDNYRGTLEWLITILRHNATNYDEVLRKTNSCRQWLPGVSADLRRLTDRIIIKFLRNKGDDFCRQLRKECEIIRCYHYRNTEKKLNLFRTI